MTAETTPLAHFTFRELLSQKSLAERALRRGRRKGEAGMLIEKIDAELERRRNRRFARAADAAPDLPEA